MKYIYLILITLVLSCKSGGDEGVPEIGLEWQLLRNPAPEASGWQSQLKLVNTSRTDLPGAWELFFNFSPGRIIDSVHSTRGVFEVQHWAGDFYSLAPANGSMPLSFGDSLDIQLFSRGSIIKNSDAPSGFYMIFERDDANLIYPNVRILPIGDQVRLVRGQEEVQVPDPAALYHAYADISELPVDEMAPLTPAPEKWEYLEGELSFEGPLRMYYPGELLNEGQFLQQILQEDFGTRLNVSETPDRADIRLGLDPGFADEEYDLQIANGKIAIQGGSAAAVFYGIQSLRAMAFHAQPGKSIRAIHIHDRPALAYRGMHLDVARNFSPKETVLKLLDLMGYYKLNTFHFHLTDDEGWRVEIPGLPELTGVGAVRMHTRDERRGLHHQYGSATSGRGSGYYSVEEYMEILRYAAARHIEVIPEIDLPGHARAAIVAMKARERELLQEGKTEQAKEFILHDRNDQSVYASVQNFSDNVVNVCNPGTYRFIEKVVKELKAMHSQAGNPLRVVHAGGDEVPAGVWEKSALCMEMFPGEEHLAERAKLHFIQEVSQILDKHQVAMAGWEEVGLLGGAHGKQVNTDLVKSRPPILYHWNNSANAADDLGVKLAEEGYPVVLSHVSNLYFDMAYSTDPNEPGFYWGGFVDTRKVFDFQYPDVRSEGSGGIIGIQGQLWTEVVRSDARLEYMVFPKLIALSERAWKGESKSGPGSSWNEFANRLGRFELPGLEKIHGPVNYRIAPAGGLIVQDTLYLRTPYPGIALRYYTSGEPDAGSTLYTKPVRVNGDVWVQTFDANGRKGLPVRLKAKNL